MYYQRVEIRAACRPFLLLQELQVLLAKLLRLIRGMAWRAVCSELEFRHTKKGKQINANRSLLEYVGNILVHELLIYPWHDVFL